MKAKSSNIQTGQHLVEHAARSAGTVNGKLRGAGRQLTVALVAFQ
jgi:hypothetical protein